MKRSIGRVVITLVILLAIGAVGAGVFVYSGIYNIGADDPHSRVVFSLLQTLRDRSIAQRARSIQVPDLQDSTMILKGAGQYAAMCTQCHLTPGMKDSEIRPGLSPQPPNLTRLRVAPADAFWVIKHGIKMSAMPAWGGSHDDATIWAMVAFLQKLPDLSPSQYKQIVARAPPDDDMDMDSDGAAGQAAHPPVDARAKADDKKSDDADGVPVMVMPDAPVSVTPPAVKSGHHHR
jgi:mono/diheme cytochrome c family protein